MSAPERGKTPKPAEDGLEAHASYCSLSMEPKATECDCQPQAKSLSDLLCPPHANLDAAGHLEPFDNCIACIRAERDELRAAQPQEVPAEQRDELLPETRKLVADFATALSEKLLASQKKYGHGISWMATDWMDECRAKLREHLEKGDPRDVANYCAFLWYHKQSTTAQPASAAKPAEDGLEAQLRELCYAAVKRHMHEKGEKFLDCIMAEFAAFVRTHQAAREREHEAAEERLDEAWKKRCRLLMGDRSVLEARERELREKLEVLADDWKARGKGGSEAELRSLLASHWPAQAS